MMLLTNRQHVSHRPLTWLPRWHKSCHPLHMLAAARDPTPSESGTPNTAKGLMPRACLYARLQCASTWRSHQGQLAG